MNLNYEKTLPMNTVRLGVIGIGNMGTTHCKKVLDGACPDFTLTAICDPARISWAKENFETPITYFDNADDMLNSGLIDACIVAVPHYDHPGLAMACMEKGIHVLVETPAGVYTKQVREMNECAKRHNVVFAMMFNQRTNHIYRKMRELVQSGVYGQIRRTNWLITNWYRSQFYYDSGAWRATWAGEGGGVLLNQCPHQLILEDFARAILKGTPLLAPGQEGLLSLSIQNRAYLSSWKNGAWISLPFNEEEFDRLLAQRRTAPVLKTATASTLSRSYDQRWQINW